MKSSLDARWTSIVKRCECVSDHPFKTSANLPNFLTPPPPFGSFLLLFVGKFGKLLTHSPLKNADDFYGWFISVETLMPTCLLPLAFLMQVQCFKSRFLAVGQISRLAMIFFASPIFEIIFQLFLHVSKSQ